MSGYRERLKNRLPDRPNISVPKGESIKGRVKGLIGRGDSEQSTHVAAPLSSLRDPASFGPPPVRRHIAAPPAPQISDSDQQESEQEEKPPPRPYRTDTTGLTTAHLPPPPGRRDSPNVSSPPPVGSRPGPPSLPPRLPPRANTASPSTGSRPPLPVRISTTESSSKRPPSSNSNNGYLNQGAISRLGASGISVPGFGIGNSQPPQDTPSAPPPSQMSELQSRFSRFGRSSSASSSTDQAPPPTTGTTWTQKQAALKTASSMRQDPSSVSMSDAKSAASTLNNFRQRHGDQVASGVRTANGLHERYNTPSTTDGSNDGVGQNSAPNYNRGPTTSPPSMSGVSSLASSMIKKKPPPPPPPKKRQGLTSQPLQQGDGNAPPPVPLSTRPQF